MLNLCAENKLILETLVRGCTLSKSPPPINVISSTNNLAIKNVLDSLNLSGRWLPNLSQYGLYLTSAGKAKEIDPEKYLYCTRKKQSGNLEDFYSSNYQEEAEKFFINEFNLFFNKEYTKLQKCKKYIHRKLLKKESLLLESIEFSNKLAIFNKDFMEHHQNLDNLKALIKEKNKAKLGLEEIVKNLKSIQKEWINYKLTQLKWSMLFSALSYAKNIISDKVKLFSMKYPDLFDESINSIESLEKILNKEIFENIRVCDSISEELARLSNTEQEYLTLVLDKARLEEELGFEINVQSIYDFVDSSSILCQLDKTLRYDMFLLATHYWEAEWLIHCKIRDRLNYSSEDRKKFWELCMMLTPCAVTTLHSGPGFFQYKTVADEFKTLNNFIDHLVIDEAGQVMPALAGAMISTAKRAILVGDTKQIEPVYSLTAGIDFANAKKFNLCQSEQDYAQLKDKGILCSGDSSSGHAYGNAIVIGQRKAKYHLLSLKVPGMLLLEHRRCPKEIISYCNELCYDGQLLPLTIERPSIYPRMGYAHITGETEKKGSSRFNRDEANAITNWLQKNQNAILQNSNAQSLDECVGIVTPFAAQGEIIRSSLNDYNISIDKAGTVHSL